MATSNVYGANRTGEFKCHKCSRVFKMAAHRARHERATHGAGNWVIIPQAKRPVGRPRKITPREVMPSAAPAPADAGITRMSIQQLSRLRQTIDGEIVGRLVRGEATIA